MYQSLQREQADANDELKIRVSKINSIAQELATINKRINLIEMTGTTANSATRIANGTSRTTPIASESTRIPE